MFWSAIRGHHHAQGQGGHGAHQAHGDLFPAGEVELLLQQAEDHGKDDEQQRDGAGCAVALGGLHQCAVGAESVEGAGHHIGKGGDDQQGEQPAEQEEQLAAQLADVFLDQQAHGFAVVLDAGVQGAEVGDGAKEDAAQQDPQQHRQPAEGSRLDGAGDGARPGDGAELMAENGPAVGGDVVLAVVQTDGRGLGGGIDAPAPGDPAPIEGIGRDEAHRRDEDDYECVHDFPFSLLIWTSLNDRPRRVLWMVQTGPAPWSGAVVLQPAARKCRMKKASALAGQPKGCCKDEG